MSSLRELYHFVPRAEVLQVDISSPYQEVQRLAGERSQGGFVVTKSGSPWCYVIAKHLAEFVVSRGRGRQEELGRLSMLSIGELLKLVSSSSPAPMLSFGPPVDVAANAAPLQNQADAVFLVLENGAPVGFFLNHETVRETLTERVWFICQKGHRNLDSDHGTCYECPFPIDRTEVERP
jgi:hypothetical protein